MTQSLSSSSAPPRPTEELLRPAVVLEGVHRRFGSVAAVNGLDLAIGEGEFFSFLGPSGCGKTTTLRLIAGFETPDAGRILLQGQEIQHLPPYRRNVNTAFQSYALFPHLDVFENIAFGLRRRGASRTEIAEKVAWSLQLVQLTGYEKRRTTQLSGGEQQRVAMARALVNTPAVLLLDEPLSALDAKLRHQMQVELKRIQREIGITFVLVTHDQEEALTLSDRIAVMNKGRFEQVGTPTEIYERPRTRFVTEFVGASNIFGGTVRAQGGGEVQVEVDGVGLVRVAHDGSVQSGDTIELFVRPEKMRLSHQAPSTDENRLEGILRTVVYQGPVTRYEVEVASGRSIAVTVTHLHIPADLRPGETLWVSWSASSGRILAKE
ncbi:MAG: ABC transporter ATP-binding protein [Proteobacteria bacterium]|nr:ABC transporter ATP-binding protein [Pseudomonadota bacterium]